MIATLRSLINKALLSKKAALRDEQERSPDVPQQMFDIPLRYDSLETTQPTH